MVRKLLRSDEVAELLDVSVDRVFSLAREGIIPSCRLGRQIRFCPEKLQQFIGNGGKALPGGWRKEL